MQSEEVGPACKRNKATVQRAQKQSGVNKGRKFWGCAAGYPSGCGFFKWQEESFSSARVPARAPPTTPAPILPGFAHYLGDWKTLNEIQNLVKFAPEDVLVGGEAPAGKKYDSLKVVGAWRISNPTRKASFDNAKARVLKPERSYDLPDEFSKAMALLGGGAPVDVDSGEVMLLHGTDPKLLYQIIFEGLDPAKASNGRFGRGTYFAENASKIDQYAREDPRFESGGPLTKLHSKLFTFKNKHPGLVRYALVCQVLLGNAAYTNDGKEKMSDGSPLYADASSSSLAPFSDSTVVPDSLIAEKGGSCENKFREFVVFKSDQIIVEHLVAYRRVQSLCNCRLPVTERTVVNVDNRGRKAHFCHWEKNDAKNCGYIAMFPRCDCDYSAKIKTSQSAKNPGREYFGCGRPSTSRSKSCNFFEWGESSASPRPSKRQRT